MKKEILVRIQQHKIKITCPSSVIPDPHVIDKIVDDINYELTQINDSGTEFFNGAAFDWEIQEPKSYLDEKVEILEESERVVFEHEQLIYEVFLRSDGDYEYNRYDFGDFISGDTLEADDGGCCSGSARDAVYMAIGE